MRKYVVKFFYGTDLRWHYEVEAANEVFALCAAMNSGPGDPNQKHSWVTAMPFKVSIELAPVELT